MTPITLNAHPGAEINPGSTGQKPFQTVSKGTLQKGE